MGSSSRRAIRAGGKWFGRDQEGRGRGEGREDDDGRFGRDQGRRDILSIVKEHLGRPQRSPPTSDASSTTFSSSPRPLDHFSPHHSPLTPHLFSKPLLTRHTKFLKPPVDSYGAIFAVRPPPFPFPPPLSTPLRRVLGSLCSLSVRGSSWSSTTSYERLIRSTNALCRRLFCFSSLFCRSAAGV